MTESYDRETKKYEKQVDKGAAELIFIGLRFSHFLHYNILIV